MFILSLAFSLHPMTLFGQKVKNNQGSGTPEDPFIMPRIEAEITPDGILDEKIWRNALVLELLYEVRPGENVPPNYRKFIFL